MCFYGLGGGGEGAWFGGGLPRCTRLLVVFASASVGVPCMDCRERNPTRKTKGAAAPSKLPHKATPGGAGASGRLAGAPCSAAGPLGRSTDGHPLLRPSSAASERKRRPREKRERARTARASLAGVGVDGLRFAGSDRIVTAFSRIVRGAKP